MKTHNIWTAALVGLTIGGCGNEHGPAAGPDASEAGPLYLAGTRVWDDTQTTSYFHVISSLESGTEIDLGTAMEVPGSAKLYAVEGVGWFAIGGGEGPTITRYTLDDHGALVEGESISLQNEGVQSLWDTLYFVSPTKAYYPDRDGTQLVVWNPMAMTIDGRIPLPETVREGYLALYGYTPILRGNELLFSVGWFDWAQNDEIVGETGLVVVDTVTDTVSRFDVDTRCGGITTAFVNGGGDAYFVSSGLAAAAYRLERLGTKPCSLRIGAGADAFDPDYLVHLDDLTAGALAGEPVPGGTDSVFLRVFDENLATVASDSFTWSLTGQSAWHWWRWTPGTNDAAQVSDLPPSTADVLWFEVDGRVFGSETTADYAETTLIELTAEGGPRRSLTAPGFLHGVARIR